MNNTDLSTGVLLALQYTEELSLKKKHYLLSAVGDPCELANKSAEALVLKVMGAKLADEFQAHLGKTDKYIRDMKAAAVDWITFADDEYPEQLREIDGFPVVIFAKGNVSLLKTDIIAVVGTRRPTRYGAKEADRFTREFGRAGLTVVSGFARGIDGIAHKACVESEYPTIAVFACGLDTVYPAEHKGLYNGILKAKGLAISEYPLGSKPMQYHFPERNRIISGLARGVFIPEAALKSGSLITVNLAIDQGKDIFVIPGNINSPESEGCNKLIREMPHAMVTCPEHVFEEWRMNTAPKTVETVELSIIETLVADALHDGEKHFEELLEDTELSASELSSLLMKLVIAGVIEETAGNYYSLC